MLMAAFTSALPVYPQATHRNTAWLSRVVLGDMPARRATLRGVRGIDLDDPAWRFLLQAGDEQTPAVGEDAPVKTGLLPNVLPRLLHGAFRGPGHVADLEVLNGDEVELAGQ